MPHDTALDAPTHRESVSTAAAPPPPAPRPVQPVHYVPPSQRPHKPAGIVTWIVWILVLAAVGAGGYWLYRHAKEAQPAGGPGGKGGKRGDGAIPVLANKARVGKMDIYLTGLGSVQALNTVTVRTRIDGAIDSIYFVEGQMVYTGDPLFQIDPRPYQVQLTQAQAQLAKDQSIRDNAQNELDRNLAAKDAVPAITIDQDRALLAQANAAMKIDAGQIAAAQLNLTYTSITAPLTGRIGLKMVDSGNMVHASDASGLAVITQVQPIAVVFNLPEDDLPQIRQHMRPRPSAALFGLLPPYFRRILETPNLRVDAYDRDLKVRIATGRLLAIDSQIDPTTGTVRLKGIFLNQDESLFPNQFVNARLLVDVLKNVVIVPTAAIQQSPKGAFVYVVKPDKTVEMRTVEVGPSEGDDTVIVSGLSGPKSTSQRAVEAMLAAYLKGAVRSAADLPDFAQLKATEGELVVVDGVDKLQEGTKVTPRRATTNPTTQSTAGTDPSAGGDHPARTREGGKSGGGKPRDGSSQGGPRGERSGGPAASQGAQ